MKNNTPKLRIKQLVW